jgi:hypothetical protein
MAISIKITPILKNKSSLRFNELLDSQQKQKVSVATKNRIDSLVTKILAKNKHLV